MHQLEFPPFRPHPLLRSTHLQTILGAYAFSRKSPYRAARHEVTLDDGDRLVLHDDRPENWQLGERVVLLAHGLCGSYASSYMMRVAEKMNAKGWRTFRKDLRGFGDGYKIARHCCHAGRSDDIAASLAYIIELCPNSPITLIGFSMGANLSLKYLGECEDLVPANLDSAVAVAPPVDLIHCARNLRRGFNRLYDWSFIRNLHHLVQRRRREVPELNDLPLRSLPRRLLEFDHFYTAPLIGYASAEEYYRRTGSGQFMATIRVPTLIITAADDPVVPVSMFDRYERSPAVALHVTSHGGHLGFIGVNGVDPDRRWLDWRLMEVVAAQEAARKRQLVADLKMPASRPAEHSSGAPRTNHAPRHASDKRHGTKVNS